MAPTSESFCFHIKKMCLMWFQWGQFQFWILGWKTFGWTSFVIITMLHKCVIFASDKLQCVCVCVCVCMCVGAGQKSRFWMRQNRRFWKRDKTADSENETKPPIPKMRQNRRFRKWDKTADSENETKPPILQKRTNCYQNCFTDKSVLA